MTQGGKGGAGGPVPLWGLIIPEAIIPGFESTGRGGYLKKSYNIKEKVQPDH